MTTQKISVYSLSDLKNTTDDALPNYLTSLKLKQSHFLTDVRLSLGYTAVVIAAITFYADYKLGWEATKPGTFWAVLAYFTLNGALTFWIWGVEKGKIFTGEIDDASTGHSLISIASSVKKHTPVYNLTVRYESTNGEEKTLEISSPFTRWFDVNGFFVAKPFQQWLASEVPLIGQLDPSNRAKRSIEDVEASARPDTSQSTGHQQLSTPRKSTTSEGSATSTKSRKGKR